MRIKQKLLSEVSEVPALFERNYFPSLDGLRAVSILLVVVIHVLMSFSLKFDFHPLANLGVQFFFVISGFLITTLLLKEKVTKGSISLKNFYIRRFYRIIPLAYFYLLAVCALNILLGLNISWYAILFSFLFVRNFFLNYKGANHLTSHYWSLAIEEQFYLIFPFILKRNLNIYMFFLAFIICFSLLFDLLHIHTSNPYVGFVFNLIVQFQGIAVGSLCSVLIFKKVIVFNGGGRYKSLLVSGLFLLTFLSPLILKSSQHLMIFIESVSFSALLILCLIRENAGDPIFDFLNHKIMKGVGMLSYSLYIWQQPLTLNLGYFNRAGFLAGFPYKFITYTSISIVSLGLLALVGYLSYFHFEKRFLKLKYKYQ
ncbi:acyltransferase [Paraflavisolibacter sp. H34]|uniref:acyltransferase family protein n=1 Tax=Huijunlia imazamoxiresistens TaxID=3127457 RepID=UPI003015B8B0